ncbi:MAG: hypothetical protein ABR573_02695 [Candidatus Dormibacteria bacterium]
MRARLLAAAQICAWVAASFTAFLALRVASIFLSIVNPAQCTDSCTVGSQAVPVTLFVFALGWIPFLLVVFVRLAKAGRGLWWAAVVVVPAHVGAMALVVSIFEGFSDADPRTPLLAACAAAADVVTGVLLVAGATWRDDERETVEVEG